MAPKLPHSAVEGLTIATAELHCASTLQMMLKLTQHCERPEIPELDKSPGQPLPSSEVYISLMQVCAFVPGSNASVWLHFRDHRTNVSVGHSCHLPSTASELWFRGLWWVGHVARMPDERLPVQVLFGQLSGPGVKGRPRDSWQTFVHKNLSTLKVGLKWYKLAQNRQAWRQLIATVCT